MFYFRRLPPPFRPAPARGGGLALLPPTFRPASSEEDVTAPLILAGEALSGTPHGKSLSRGSAGPRPAPAEEDDSP
eukprot:3206191-Pyramimonas_sp.AAC.1